MRLLDHLLDQAEAHGIRALFGIPDPALFALFDAAAARGWAVATPHHEAAAGFMAEGWVRLKGAGQGAIAAASLGPGFANLLPAMAHAQAEASPVLFLASRRHGLGAGPQTGRFQHLPQLPLAAATLDFAADFSPAHLAAALAHLPNGPAYLELDGDGLAQTCPPLASPAPDLPDLPDLAPALALIAQAQSPLILAGHGVQMAQAGDALVALANRLAAPILATPALGSIAQAVPYGFCPTTRALIAQADLVLAIGTQLGDQVHFGQSRHWKAAPPHQRWLEINRRPSARRPIDHSLQADLRQILPALTQKLPSAPTVRQPASNPAAANATAARAAQARAYPPSPIHPARLVVEVTAALPPNAILIRDGGAGVLFQLGFGQTRPQDVLWSQNAAHLGTGLPMAIGAMLASRAISPSGAISASGKTRPALLLTGDSALLFHSAELSTAAQLRLPLVVVVAVDHQWGLEMGMARRLHGASSPHGASNPHGDVPANTGLAHGTRLRFDALAAAHGCHSAHVTHADALPTALASAMATATQTCRPYLIHAEIDPQANAHDWPDFPEFASWFAT